MAYDEPGIPAKGFAEASYAVHRPSDARQTSSSSHPEDHDDERPNTPPPYSGPTSPTVPVPSSSSSSSQPLATYPGLPRLNYRFYLPQDFTLSEDKTTITSYYPRLSIYPTALVSLMHQLATVPPKPQIRIVGTSTGGTVNFDIKINMMNLIYPDEARKGRMNYVKIIGPGEMGFRGDLNESVTPAISGGLEEWARKYCQDPSSIKRFTLERIVTNWDTSYLEGRLFSLIASTSYLGHTAVSFPTTHSKVVVHSPDKVNRFFSNVTKAFMGTKKYAIVKSVWPYADLPRGEQGRRCTVQEEEVWFNEWKDAIKHAILARRQGWVTAEDRLEFLMEPWADEGKPADWGSY